MAEAGVPSNELLATLSPPTRSIVLAGMLAPARFIPRADRVRGAIRNSLAKALHTVDFLCWPTTPAPAPALDESSVNLPSGRVLTDMANVRHTLLSNLTGVPGISIPIGLHSSKLPMGLQLLAPWGGEARLLDAAEHLERATDREFVDLVPPLAR
jgi:Asp-tRNA(Asn)/Glu-tRNA(Gln) amidotransferase A subunit family amidase